MLGVLVLVVARCATGPHPSPLPPSGRGDALLWEGGVAVMETLLLGNAE